MGVLLEFLETTGFATMTWGNVLMIGIGLLFITLAITKHYEPLLLLPIGFGAIVGNIPSIPGMARPEVVAMVSGSSSWRHIETMPQHSVSP